MVGVAVLPHYDMGHADSSSELFHVERTPWTMAPPSIPTMVTERLTLYFRGHVQGVGFRSTTYHLLRDLPVTGFVRNLPDGRVEIVMEGDKPSLEQGAALVHAAMARNITHREELRSLATGEFPSFRILR